MHQSLTMKAMTIIFPPQSTLAAMRVNFPTMNSVCRRASLIGNVLARGMIVFSVVAMRPVYWKQFTRQVMGAENVVCQISA